MALIGTLRNKMGIVLAAFIFLALLAFILGALLENNSVLFNQDGVGEIAGHEVSRDEYQQLINEREISYEANTGRRPSDRESENLRAQAWELLILRHAITPEYDKLGLQVTQVELEDMVKGANIDQNLKQAFTNPETGLFERDKLDMYLSRVGAMPEDSRERMQWRSFEKDLVLGRQRIKYENLLLKSNYVTAAEAEREYHQQTDVAEVKYLYVPFYAVSDSTAAVSDTELKDYYNKNVERFRTEPNRDLKYVTFNIEPSSKDTADIKADMEKIATELAKAEDDSAYAVSTTDGAQGFGQYNAGSLPEFVNVNTLSVGSVVGPFVDGATYKVVKVSAITKDTVYSARAAHILFRWDDPSDASKKAAKEKARGVLKEIKGGADFAAMARQHGTDGTASRGGDLGWFQEGRMVKPFEDAVFGATKTGVLNDVVETDFGYHIISITNVKNNTAYKLAIVERPIAPSDATIQEAYNKAGSFAANIESVEQFQEKAKESKIPVREAKNIGPGDASVGTLGEARQVVQWLFRDAEVNKVSDVFELQGQYAVAIMSGETKKGYRSFESVKEEITPLVKKEVQAKQIIAKLNGLNGSLEEIAQSFGKDATVHTSSDLKMSNNSLPAAGFDPVATGVAFSLENGKRSKAFKGETGVLIVELQNKTVAPEIADYTAYKDPLENNARNRAGYSIAEAIKEYADIEDTRYKFF